MNYALPYLVALAAALPTTLAVLGLWVAHARIVDGYSADSVFLSFVFLFVSLIFFVSVAANVVAVALTQGVAILAPGITTSLTIALAGALVVALCAWTQRGTIGSAPVSALPVALFAVADMLILASGLALLPPISF